MNDILRVILKVIGLEMINKRPLTPELVRSSIQGIRPRYKSRLEGLLRMASSDSAIGRLELDLHPWLSAKAFPVGASACTEKRVDPRTPVSNAIVNFFKHEPALLPPDFRDLPIGRGDVAGLSFVAESDWIAEALTMETQAIWTELQAAVRPTLGVYLGTDIWVQEEESTDGIKLLNLRSGQWGMTLIRRSDGCE